MGFWPGAVGAKGPAFSGPSKGLGGGREGSTYKKTPLPSTHEPILSACGLDFGSRYVKLVYAGETGALARRRLDTITFYRYYLSRDLGRLRIDWPRLRLPEPESLVVTGYGKNLLQQNFPAIT